VQEQKFDLIVLGSGPGGEKGAAQAAYFGKKVAIVELHDRCGGAGTNTGTLPSKTLRETSLTLSGLKARNLYGVDLSIRRQATVSDFLYREKLVKDADQNRVRNNIEQHGISLFHGFGRFVDAHTIEVLNKEKRVMAVLTAPTILIATGSSPHRPAGYDFDHPAIYDSDEILELGFMPKSMVIVGAGVIGCEYACTFAALGIEVTLVDGKNRLLDFLDVEVSRTLAEAMTDLGVRIRSGRRVSACKPLDQGQIQIELDNQETIYCESVLVSSGRNGNTKGLQLEKAGLSANSRGCLEVNEKYQTSALHIYAVGDVIGFPALASTSMEQGRVAMVHAFDLNYKTKLASILPYGIYSIPEVSMTGDTEESLKEKGVDYVVGRAYYNKNSRGIIIGDQRGFLKLLFLRENMKLVGVHIIGEQASELVHIGLMAMQMNANVQLFIEACFNYPTLGDLYKYASYDALQNRDRV